VNPRVEAIEGSLIRALNARKRPSSIDLGLGEPSLMPNMAYLEAAARWVATNGCRYTPNAGDPEFRDVVARHYGYPQLDRAENVIATQGSQEAVYICIKALLDPARDSILIVEPAFPVYRKCAQLEGIAVQTVQLAASDGFAFDPDRILAAVTPQTRMIVICSPSNPTARVISRAAVERLASALLARGGEPVYVMHDEIYREQTFVDDAGWFGEVYPHTLAINSLSKSNALTGMRMGWAIAPSAVIPAMSKAHAWVVSTANTFAQRVAIEIFATPGGLQEHHRWYAEQRAGTLGELDSIGLRHLPIEGSFYVAVHIGDATNSLAFAERLIEEDDVVAIPGSNFAPSFEGWLRCSWVAPLERVREGFARIARKSGVLAVGG